MKKNAIAALTLVVLAVAVGTAAHCLGLVRIKTRPAAPAASACSSGDGHDHDPDSDREKGKKDDHGAGNTPTVHLTRAQARLIKIQISEAAAGDIRNVLCLNGEIQLNMDRTARIMPRMPGFVTEVLVKEGDTVKAGTVLARLTSHKLGEYHSAYNSASELEKLTLAEFKMAEKLKANRAISEKEFLRYSREYADAVIARHRAEAMLKSLLIDPAHHHHAHDNGTRGAICTEYEISAPIDGTVIEKNITVGENFPEDNNKVVFTISNMKELWLNLRANGTDMRMLRTGMAVTATPADSDRKYQGRTVYLAPLIDETTRTGLVRVLLNNADGSLRPGEFATGAIRMADGTDLVTVPREAVQLIAGETVIFVPAGDGFAGRVVSVGQTVNGRVQISAGLKAGEAYVSLGAFELKSVLLTSGMDPHAGHGH